MKRELFKNTFIIALGKFSTQIISYFLLPLYTAVLTTSQYGTYDFIVTLYVFLVPFVTLLMEEAMFRFLIDNNNENGKKKIMSNACIYVIFSVIVWTLILLLLFYIFKFEYKLAFILYIISSIFISLCNSISRGLGKMTIYAFSNFILSLSTIILNILFIVSFKWGVEGLLYSTIISNVLIGMYIFIKLKIYNYINFKNFDKSTLKEMVKYSYPLVPNSIGWSIINISDRIIVTVFLGTSANGIYAMANKFPNIINTFSTFFFTAFKENASKVIKKEKYVEYYTSIQDIVHRGFITISLILMTTIPFVFDFFINKSYGEAYQYIPILIIALYYGNMSGFYGSLFVAMKETKIIGKTTIVGAIINIFVNLLLIRFIGIYAAVISTFIANYVVNLYRKIKVNDFFKLGKIRNYNFSLFLLILTAILYYINNLYINVFSLLIVGIYAMLSNKDIIVNLVSIMRKKIFN